MDKIRKQISNDIDNKVILFNFMID